MSCANFNCSAFRGSRSKLRSYDNFEEVRPVCLLLQNFPENHDVKLSNLRHFLKGLGHVMNFVKTYRIRSAIYVPMQLVFLKKIYDCIVNLRENRFKGTSYWKQRWAGTGINRSIFINCLFGKCLCRALMDTITRGA